MTENIEVEGMLEKEELEAEARCAFSEVQKEEECNADFDNC